MRELGRKIRQRRTKADLSVRALADQVGKSHAWLSNLERGIGNPKSEDLTAIAVLLGDKPEDYLRLAGRVNLAAAHVVPAAEDMPAWARRLEQKVDALSEALAGVKNEVAGSATGLAELLALLNPANGRQPGSTRGAPVEPPQRARRRRADPASAGSK